MPDLRSCGSPSGTLPDLRAEVRIEAIPFEVWGANNGSKQVDHRATGLLNILHIDEFVKCAIGARTIRVVIMPRRLSVQERRMPLEVMLWQVDTESPEPVPRQQLNLEERLEDWLFGDISMLSNDLLVIGRQIRQFSVPLDLLAVDRDGNLVVIELKRDRTPREVVAQALDYASWVQWLDREDLDRYAQEYLKRPFDEAFMGAFGHGPPDVVNERQRMYIVASSLDPSTQRIVEYLAHNHGVDINAATFSYFNISGGEFVARSLFLDDEEVSQRRRKGSGRKASKRQSVRVEEGQLVVEFADGPSKKWDLPEQADKEALQHLREAVRAFGDENEATDGQIHAIYKALNSAGYYVNR